MKLDQQGHFLAGYGIAITTGLLSHSLILALTAAMLAEAAKIVFLDVPAAKKAGVPMDWTEKGADTSAQLAGAIVGCAILYAILP